MPRVRQFVVILTSLKCHEYANYGGVLYRVSIHLELLFPGLAQYPAIDSKSVIALISTLYRN